MSTVLFLCSANYYRSRFAEHFFNWLAEINGMPWRADSRGLMVGGWGNIGADNFVFTDHPPAPVGPLAEQPDFGTLSLALLRPQSGDRAAAELAAAPAT